MHEKLLLIYCICDDFCKVFEPAWNDILLEASERQRVRPGSLSLAEIMSILLAFQISGFRTFKAFYFHLWSYHRAEFPGLVSYQRFVELEKSALVPLAAFSGFISGPCTGISFIDASALAVCKNKRIFSHKVFDGFAKRGKTTMGWFFGFKIHLVINEHAQILAFKITAGNVDDRTPVEKLCKNLWGKIFGDKGYISKGLFEKLWEQGKQLVTALKKNMKPKLLPIVDSMNLGKRSMVESVLNVLKNSCHLEHSRHRSMVNFMVNIVASISAYGLRFLGGFEPNILTTKP